MPLSKYHIRNEFSLADPELYRAADKDDPEALLEAIAMAGLVGLLRQLGDLAEFAAEIFHDLHEEVMATAARGHGLTARVQQLEAEVPSLEKAFYSQTHHSSFFTNGGIDWHPNLRSEQNLVTRGDMPRFVMDSYEECRGPPRLFLLDKFDVAGAGACLKRYTDPSFFKMESASPGTSTLEVHREKRIRKVKQKKGARLRDGEAPNAVPAHAKLHQLLLEERIENGYINPARLVKLKKRQLNGSGVDAKAGKYMAKFVETPSPDHKMICEGSCIPPPVKLSPDDTSEAGIKILEISTISPVQKSLRNENTGSSLNEQEIELKPFSEVDGEPDGEFVKVKEQMSSGVFDEISSSHSKLADENELVVDEHKKIEGILDGYHSDGVTSEVDNYMDALTTMESEMETDDECKPKKSFLNILKVSDTDGKEESQLEARFSDSPSFGDSSVSDEINSFKQDRNEEHIEVKAQLSDSCSTGTSSTSDSNSSLGINGNENIELQAHSSDSQSIGDSSISDENSSFKKDRSFSLHSNSSSTVAENIQLKPILSTNTKYCEPGIEETQSNQLTQIVESENKDWSKFVVDDDANVHQEEISDSGQVSCDLMTLGPVLGSNLGPISPVTQPAGTQSNETSSDPVELNLRIDNAEDIADVGECVAAKSVSLPLIKYDAFAVDSFDKKSGSLDNGNLESAHEDECYDRSEIIMLQVESHNKNSSEILISEQGENHIFPSMEELGSNLGTMLTPGCQDSKDEGCMIATQLKSEDLSPAVEIPSVSCFTGEPSSDSTHDIPPDEPGPVEKVLYSDLQSNSEEIPKMVHNDKSGSTCNIDSVEGDGHFKHPSSPDNHVMVNDVVTENVHSEDQAVFTIPSVDYADADIVTCLASGHTCSPSGGLSNFQEPFLVSSDSYQIEMESNRVDLTQISKDLNAEKRENQLEPSLDIASSDFVYSPISNNPMRLEDSFSTFEDSCGKEMEANEVVARRKSLTELEELKMVNQQEIASADVPLNLNKSVPCDLSDSEICSSIYNSSPRELFKPAAFVDGVKTVPEFAGSDTQQSESIFYGQSDLLQNRTDSSSPSGDNLQSETDFSPSQAGEKGAEVLPGDVENPTFEKSQPHHMRMHQLEQESTHATSEFLAEIHADVPSSCSLQPSSGQEVYPRKHALDPLTPLLPDVFPMATENDLGVMPPMPPLPPMQWRMSKFQHASQVSQGEEIGVSQPSIQPMQPIKPEKISQFGLPTSERETLLHQNPFLPVMALESDRLQHSSGFSVGISGHPVAIPFQFPIMVNEAQGQYNYVVLDTNQIQNPFLTLPVVSTGRPPHGYIVSSEGEMLQNANLASPIPPAECAVSGNDSIYPQEKLSQPPSQLMTETSSEIQALQLSESNEVSIGRPSHGYIVSSEGEMVQNSNLCPLTPPAECAVSGNDSFSPQEKLAQPPSQLMTETSSEDKTVTAHQSTSNVEEEQGHPSISLMSPPNVEGMQPDQNLLPSEEEMASFLDTSAQTSNVESERTNGKPKLPRPRNPLIDAVVAHDKSKLRRVTERVMPQLAPKVDERDSLLEQIRTKSFNLKPAVATRPSIQGPKTNLKLAAILEKANAIRQALAGSDEDDDGDSWSDS